MVGMSDSPSASSGLSVHRERTRTRGVQPIVLKLTRAILKPFLLVFFRMQRIGREHVPDGAVILASNHRSFLDPFVVGMSLNRPVYFVAKKELFDRRLTGWFLNCLGAFPIRRGEADEESVETAEQILNRGDPRVVLPQGTGLPQGSLRRAEAGVGAVG